MKRRTSKKKLEVLKREIRSLTKPDLGQVAGGGDRGYGFTCNRNNCGS